MLFDAKHPRLNRPENIRELYNNPEAAEGIGKAKRLVFVDSHWESVLPNRLIKCRTLDVTVLTFPEGNGRSTSVGIVSREAFEREVLAKDGKARMCFE